MRDKILNVTFSILCIAVCCTVIHEYRKGAETSKWPNTNGKIISAKVESEVIPAADEGDKTIYTAEVVYEYTVNEKKYTCNRIGIENDSVAEATIKKYPKGKKVKVYYDPANPNEAVLETGVNWSSHIMLIFIGFLVVILLIIPMSIRIHERIKIISLEKSVKEGHERRHPE